MLKKFTFAIDAYPLELPEVTVVATTEKVAHGKVWDSLPDETKNMVSSLECIDVADITEPWTCSRCGNANVPDRVTCATCGRDAD